MKRVVAERYGGPEVLRLVDEPDPRPGPGEVRVRVLAAGVSFTDALVRAGSYLGGPRPPFTPGYEIAGVVEEAGAGCTARRPGDRVAALVVWGGYAERVCVPEAHAVPVPADVDPAVVVSLAFPYLTAFQLLHRVADARRGETVLVHGAAGRVGSAVLELGALEGVRLLGTASAADLGRVEELGAVAIDRRSDLVARVRELTGTGADVVLDGIGGPVSIRSFRALGPGGRLVIFGHAATISAGHRSRRGWLEWYAATALVGLAGALRPGRRVLAYRIAKLRDRHPDWLADDLRRLLELLREGAIHPVVAERLPLADARRAHELLERSAAAGKLVLVP